MVHSQRLLILAGAALLLTGCPNSSFVETAKTSAGVLTDGTSTTTTTVPSGTKAVRVIFTNTSSGSFDAASASGTAPAAGSGHSAVRLYTTSNTLLAEGAPGSTNWPSWFQGLEIGVSGTSNTAATNANCARFATTNEDSSNTCNYGGANVNCGAAAGLFRVSEYDCTVGGATAGTGGPSDGVYIRAYFSRDTANLGSTENILVSVEYAASGLRTAAATPTACFTGGTFAPSTAGCADFVWNAYLKPAASDTVSPFLMLMPPAFGKVDWANSTASNGGGVGTKQFMLPLAADSTLTTLQLSRISGIAATTTVVGPSARTFQQACDAGNDGSGNSPLCSGVIFHSITFFRM